MLLLNHLVGHLGSIFRSSLSLVLSVDVTLFDDGCLPTFSSCSGSIHETKHRLGSSVIIRSVYRPQQLPVVQLLSNLSLLLLCPYAMNLSTVPPFALCLRYPFTLQLLKLMYSNVLHETVLLDSPSAFCCMEKNQPLLGGLQVKCNRNWLCTILV